MSCHQQLTVSQWVRFYEGRGGNEYLEYVKDRYAPFICSIAKRIQPKDMVLEIGCGTATITSILHQMFGGGVEAPYFVASDSDLQMLSMACRRLNGLPRVSTVLLDCRQGTKYADFVHSHGLLEHFDDKTIRQIIRAHSYARVQVHYVPGNYDKPSFGDERLMTVKQWQDICQPNEVFTFNGGLDYGLVFR